VKGTRGVLLVDHGSRLEDANALLDSIARAVAERIPDRLVRSAHLELASPGVPEALDALVAEGAREIVVVPFFLAPGRHSTQDIPGLVEAGVRRHPDVRMRVGAPLGAHPGLVEATITRIREA
jgi:sirohydrochlorin ferrochelatase